MLANFFHALHLGELWIFRSALKSIFEKENGLEGAIYGRTDHWVFEAG
jgi:hypothetical protein